MILYKIKKIDRDDIVAYILCALVFALPFITHLLSYGVILACIATLLQNDFKRKFIKAIRNKGFILIVAFYLLNVIGMLYTKNLNRGFHMLQVKLTLILIPFIVFVSSISINKYIRLIAIGYIAGNFLSAIMCIMISFFLTFQNGVFSPSVYNGFYDWSFFKLLIAGYTHFNYSFLSHFIHVNYFSMYLLLATYIVYHELTDKWGKLGTGGKLALLLLIVFFMVTILLLQSRAAILSFLIIAFIEIVFFMRKPGYFGVKISAILFISAIVFLILFKSGRFIKITESVENFNYEKLKEKELRISLWESSFSLIGQHPLIGVGTGDVKDEYRKIYNERLKKITGGKYYNAHNEFLQITMQLGIIGILFLLLLIFWPLMQYKGYGYRLKYEFFFIVVIIINFSFESMLNRFNGVIFFSLFYSFLCIFKSD